MKPLCFVLMPFGVKPDKQGRDIDFNYIYETLIKVAIEKCDMEPIRADEELLGGTIHKPMYERLVLCDYAIADLTTLNANVFYELGLRHAIKGYTTIPIFAFDADLPFDLKMQRTLPYKLDAKGKIIDVDAAITMLAQHLRQCKEDKSIDSPVFQLIDGWNVSHNLSLEKTDVFRKQAVYENDVKDELFAARNNETKRKEKVLQVFKKLSPLKDKSVGVIVDLFLSLRAVEAWKGMIDCYEEMDAPVQKVKMVQEQLAFAYNRVKEHERAKKILTKLLEDDGYDPETNGILGRVYKDMFKAAKKNGDDFEAKGYLKSAIKSYKEGFDSDWRDAYPGVNLVTLLEVNGDTQTFNEYLPVVDFAVKRKVATTTQDYWDLATLAELNILKRDYEQAGDYLMEAIPLVPDKATWMFDTTADNFQMILDGRIENENADGKLIPLITHLRKLTDKNKKK